MKSIKIMNEEMLLIVYTNNAFYLCIKGEDEYTHGVVDVEDIAKEKNEFMHYKAVDVSIKAVSIGLQEVESLLFDTSVEGIIYTGSLVSKQSSIPDQRDVEFLFYFNDPEKLKDIVNNNPSQIGMIFKKIIMRLYIAKQNIYHKKILEISRVLNKTLITDNIDMLQSSDDIICYNAMSDSEYLLMLKPAYVFLIGNMIIENASLLHFWASQNTRIVVINEFIPSNLTVDCWHYSTDFKEFLLSININKSQ